MNAAHGQLGATHAVDARVWLLHLTLIDGQQVDRQTGGRMDGRLDKVLAFRKCQEGVEDVVGAYLDDGYACASDDCQP
eukprot:359622-Chlamydomonas_euryale.AAC.23